MSRKHRPSSVVVATTSPAEPETTSVDVVPSDVTIANVDAVEPEPAMVGFVPAVASMSPWVTVDGADKPVSANRHTGRYTGRGIEQFQNELYVMNRDGFVTVDANGDRVTIGLTDYELAILWAVEFPGARCDYMAHVNYVASTRTDFVNGRHPSPDPRAAGCNITFGIDGKIATRPVRTPVRPTVTAPTS